MAGVVMIHEAFGLEEVMQRQAKRLAAAGFLTLAVDLYSAGGAKRCLVPTMTSMLRGHGKAFTDIEVARSWLVESPDCTGKIGVIGFCMGGGFAMVSAGDFDAASVNYGQLPRKLDEAVVDACPIVGSFGGKDFSLRGAAAKLETALDNAGIENDVKEYPPPATRSSTTRRPDPRCFVRWSASSESVPILLQRRMPGSESTRSSSATWHDQRLVLSPPLTANTWPVICRAPGEAKKWTADAMSSGVPARLVLVDSISIARRSSVRKSRKNSVSAM
ncbi:hypothetical protein GCM10020255_111120 [Rhodococcus baikonurensis]